MLKVTIFLIAINVVLVNCIPTGMNWQHSSHPVDHSTNGDYSPNSHHTQVIEKPKDAISPIVTEENVMTVQKPLVNPVSYLPSFIQGLLPQVITQAIGQLAAYIPGLQRAGMYPQQQYGLAYPSYVSVTPGLPINIAQIYFPGQAGILPHQASIMQQQAGILPHQIGYWQQQPGIIPQQPAYLPYGLYR